MSGEHWIKMRVDLAEDPHVIRMAAQLGISADEVVGKLHRLWSWADKHTADGRVGIHMEWIDQKIGRQGFAVAMKSVGWLDFSGDEIQFPEFEKHNGKSAKRRAQEADRKREDRSGGPDPVRDLSASDADTLRTRERERVREEKTIPLPNGKGTSTPGRYEVPPCPYGDIVNAYHDALPTLRKVMAITSQRKGTMQARWREVCTTDQLDAAGGMEFFRDYWRMVAASPFLMGNAKPGPNRSKPFIADFDWLLAPTNFIKVVERKYDEPSKVAA